MVRRSGIGLAAAANESSVLNPGDVFRIGEGEITVGTLRGVQFNKSPRLDEPAAETMPLFIGSVAPFNGSRLAEGFEFLNPGKQAPV